MVYRHVSVMPTEVQKFLDPKSGEMCVDGTVGGAGHAEAICRSIAPSGLFIGLDQDRAAIDHATKILSPYASMVHLFNANFTDLPDILTRLEIESVNAMVVDLGLSLYQIKGSGRGFSFQVDEPLDMRMNPDQGATAADLVNRMAKEELVKIFKTYGEERWSRRIASAIVAERKKEPIVKTGRLVDVVKNSIPASGRSQRIHPATRVFMALRIAVNRELDCLATFLDAAPGLLKSGGRLCMIAFHSLEDRMIKKKFRDLAEGCNCPPVFPVCTCDRKPVVSLLTRKVVRPSEYELKANPMARSARLRAFVRL